MNERPILFSGPMVRALLDGTKTQTRRVVKPMPKWAKQFPICKPEGMKADHEILWWNGEHEHVGVSQSCPYGKVGDRLWVREAHTIHSTHGQHRIDDHRWGPWDGLPTRFNEDRTKIAYFREGFDRSFCGKWKPSIHMPRWASRLTLEITDVRVERLQDISEPDAMAEGAEPCANGVWFDRNPAFAGSDAKGAYYALWEAINGKGSWAANPWVWVVSFEVVK